MQAEVAGRYSYSPLQTRLWSRASLVLEPVGPDGPGPYCVARFPWRARGALSSADRLMQDRTIEATERREEPVVNKDAKVKEEVIIPELDHVCG